MSIKMKLSYGELVAIYDGLCKLPEESLITYKHGIVKFEPVKVGDLKEKIKWEVAKLQSRDALFNNKTNFMGD